MKRGRWLFLLVAVSLLGLTVSTRGQEAQAPAQTRAATASTRVVVPADTTIPLVLKNTINSRTAFVGQAIYCETIYPITVDSHIVIPVGTYVKGAVTQVKRPGRIKGKAQIGLRFDSITLPNGTTHALRATLSSYAGNSSQGFRRDESKIEGESSKGEDAGKIATTATEGTIIGGLSTGRPKGAGIGALGGGVGSLIWVLATRGKEVLLAPGTNLELQLSAPLSFEPAELDYNLLHYPEGPALPPREPGPRL
jgi:hypothetical protein